MENCQQNARFRGFIPKIINYLTRSKNSDDGSKAEDKPTKVGSLALSVSVSNPHFEVDFDYNAVTGTPLTSGESPKPFESIYDMGSSNGSKHGSDKVRSPSEKIFSCKSQIHHSPVKNLSSKQQSMTADGQHSNQSSKSLRSTGTADHADLSGKLSPDRSTRSPQMSSPSLRSIRDDEDEEENGNNNDASFGCWSTEPGSVIQLDSLKASEQLLACEDFNSTSESRPRSWESTNSRISVTPRNLELANRLRQTEEFARFRAWANMTEHEEQKAAINEHQKRIHEEARMGHVALMASNSCILRLSTLVPVAARQLGPSQNHSPCRIQLKQTADPNYFNNQTNTIPECMESDIMESSSCSRN